jgi:hypothetical protein
MGPRWLSRVAAASYLVSLSAVDAIGKKTRQGNPLREAVAVEIERRQQGLSCKRA